MIEALIVGVTAYLFTWPALLLLIVAGILFEHNGARSWAVFLGIVALLVSYFMFDVPLQTLVVAAVGYVGVGVVWSFWRYKVHVDERVASLSEVPHSSSFRQQEVAKLAPSRMADTIVAWIIIWPFSMVENVLGDVLTMIRGLVDRVFKGVYNRIYSKALATLEIKEPEV